MIREDCELLAELARLNTAMASLAMRIMDGSASEAEQQNYARRLIAAGERLRRRANETAGAVVEGEVLANGPFGPASAYRMLRRRADEMNHPVIEGEVLSDVSLALPAHTMEPDWKPWIHVQAGQETDLRRHQSGWYSQLVAVFKHQLPVVDIAHVCCAPDRDIRSRAWLIDTSIIS